jgi:type I restriction enzyme S subunit
MTKLPKGWKEVKLGDIGKVSMCKRIYKDQTSIKGDIPFYKIGTFGKEPDAFISNDIYKEYKNKFSFPKIGDILISASGTIGRRVIYNGKPAYFQDSNIVWIDNDEKKILNEYLYHFYENCDWGSTKGATISRLYNDNLRNIKINYPDSLPEQKRIVSILDKAFKDIEKAKANYEKNLKNAKELFQSKLDEIFSNKGDGWIEKKLGDVCVKIFAGGDVPKPDFSKYETKKYYIPIYSNGVKDNGLYGFTNIEKVNQPSITISARGTIGYPIKRYNSYYPVIRLIVVIPNIEIINLEFLYYYLSKFDFIKSGTSIPQLTVPMVKPIIISYPISLKEQQEIVNILDKLKTETQKLETTYIKQLENLEELKKSLLEKAFKGEL